MDKWTIGELAQATGLTIRTPHHYDEIGLVSAGERTDAGHRRGTCWRRSWPTGSGSTST